MSARRHALVLAGGTGTRLWPLSRRARPKQFLRLGGGERTLLQAAVDRVRPLVPPERLWVVAKPWMAGEVHREVPDLPEEHLLLEPCPRGTAAAVLLGALAVMGRDPEAVLAVLPSDHVVGDAAAFRRVLDAAFRWAADHPDIVAVGLRPRRPETAFGYVETAACLGTCSGVPCHRAASFHEKPGRAEAEAFLRSGRHYWNAGMALFRPGVLVETVERRAPALAAALGGLRAALGGPAAGLEAAYAALPPDSLDVALLEQADNLVVFEADFDWHDVGLWEGLREMAGRDPSGNALLGGGEAVLLDAAGLTVHVEAGRLVAALGVRDLVVAVVGEAVLVCPRDRIDDLPRLVAELERRGRGRFL
ncbi:NTP transferase domain-containing protein [Dissulfurirhabdus thermomarina]|uniref:NTP transferase domain-containing protein n=1 Tax=Dissulfurirhabdus thermomarina TaxID=1765737 RepID=A0A6N9TUY2_DISTH|nr:sugar phosphate nucleotidyltransferase [Dissulfurirhabdus thermomarina]NDY43544.1 NTP transferase domain-containing protein [Dissulfurirhabdus thermomarina]NMX24371.1 NTP transferase domain-containing protein [Dissulfurirhabdus thermomarina]